MTERGSVFDVHVLTLTASSAIADQLDATARMLERPLPVFAHTTADGFHDFEGAQLNCRRVSTADALVEDVRELTQSPGPARLIVVSDGLVAVGSEGRTEPTRLAQEIRGLFLTSEAARNAKLCGLVGMVDGPAHRTRDIDRVVDVRPREGVPDSVAGALRRVAAALWLKAPPRTTRAFGDGEAVFVRMVKSKEQLRECLRLRHLVYGLMGYLDDEVAENGAPIELDQFDSKSIQFAAVAKSSGDVVGTMRLVLQDVPQFAPGALVERPVDLVAEHADWCGEIAEASGLRLSELLRRPPFLPLPILNNSDFGERWPNFLQENHMKFGGEISRVVVAPRYQGMGVSRVLLRAGIAVACDLQRQFLLLECIPVHEAMYVKHGFERLPGHHCRAQGLDQVAVGMRLDLRDHPFNSAAKQAQADAQVMRASRGDGLAVRSDDRYEKSLCLCGNSRCWKEGQYESLGRIGCPLRSS